MLLGAVRVLHQKKEKKLRDVTSHTFAQTTHVALPPPMLSCRVGSLVPVRIVIHAKFHQNRFKGFDSLRGRDLLFSYT